MKNDVTMIREQRDLFGNRHRRRWCWLGCLLLGASGCAQVSPLRSPFTGRGTAPAPVVQSHAASRANDAARDNLVHNNLPHSNLVRSNMARNDADGLIADGRAAGGPVNGDNRAAPFQPVVPAAYHPTAGNLTGGTADALVGIPCIDPSQIIPGGMAGECGRLAPIVAGSGAPYWNDQEYLYDGGDREPRVQVMEDWEVRGLDSQDTVAHYETLDGKLCVTPTNRVPIYAPRFGAVRKVAAPILAARAVGAERVLEPTGPVVQQSRDLAGDIALPTGPRNQNNVKLIDGLRDRTRGVPAETITPLVNLSNPQVAFQHLEGLGTAVRREDLEARLAELILNARTWVNDESIAIMIGGVQAVELRDAKQVQDLTVFETEPGKCTLRICKAASHSAASPGDIVSFSIRFDNIGDKPIGNLVVLDSLTTRLEYIDGSQQCILSIAGNSQTNAPAGSIRFSTSENEAGSTVLRWEADQPLASGDSGVISFRCRVR